MPRASMRWGPSVAVQIGRTTVGDIPTEPVTFVREGGWYRRPSHRGSSNPWCRSETRPTDEVTMRCDGEVVRAWGTSTRESCVVWFVRSGRRPTEGGFVMATRRCLRYDPNARSLSGKGGAAHLRRQEGRLFEYLLEHAGAWVSTETLARDVFDRANPSDASSLSLVRQHVFNLRRKLVDAGATLSTLSSVPTLGYRLDPDAVARE